MTLRLCEQAARGCVWPLNGLLHHLLHSHIYRYDRYQNIPRRLLGFHTRPFPPCTGQWWVRLNKWTSLVLMYIEINKNQTVSVVLTSIRVYQLGIQFFKSNYTVILLLLKPTLCERRSTFIKAKWPTGRRAGWVSECGVSVLCWVVGVTASGLNLTINITLISKQIKWVFLRIKICSV